MVNEGHWLAVAAAQMGALVLAAAALSKEREGAGASFTRRMAQMGIADWVVWRAQNGAATYLTSRSPPMLRRLAEHGLPPGGGGAIMDYGRSAAPPERLMLIDAAMAGAMAAGGLANGVVCPFGDGGFAVIFGPESPTPAVIIDAMILCAWFADAGDFSAAPRRNLDGITATAAEAAVCRALSIGEQWATAAAAAKLSQSGAREALRRVKAKLEKAGRLPPGASRSEVVSAAIACGMVDPVVADGDSH